jgi:hypothetical protein
MLRQHEIARCDTMPDQPKTPTESAVIDRLHQLRVILPAMAKETAITRREAARLRVENARLARRVAELEARGSQP